MFCTNCGNPVEEGAAFCTKCGAKIDPPAPDPPAAPAAPTPKPACAAVDTAEAPDPDRKLPFKARAKAKWNRILAKQFGIGPDAGPEGPAPTYDWWRNTLAVLTAFLLVVLLVGIVVWIVASMVGRD